MTLVGRQIPTWFNHVNEGSQVSFEVPKEIGCNAKALAVCLASIPHDYVSSCYIYVINHTKGTSFYVEIVDIFPLEEILWLGNLSLSETEFNLEEGDLVHVIAHGPVKKIGVRLVCDKLMTFEDEVERIGSNEINKQPNSKRIINSERLPYLSSAYKPIILSTVIMFMICIYLEFINRMLKMDQLCFILYVCGIERYNLVNRFDFVFFFFQHNHHVHLFSLEELIVTNI
ncbi:hypothetical protein D8674_041398 [Pyrus ussuriensis x Pyrus communis]|uniref:C-JID domain-containing protein n=1 Tax=Pyrus ussuriensis x Pyrus communis TaxID=2448454 RepID=A0A5N5FKY7_9ROSA|nr:hypothetical protein D8674_041398 [Pyrus ussuriensis x Pyrus communis]